MTTLTPHITHYQGHDITHASGLTDWFTVVNKHVEHYFIDLRSAMDYCDEQFNKRWKIPKN